jgi:hypothetical protein
MVSPLCGPPRRRYVEKSQLSQWQTLTCCRSHTKSRKGCKTCKRRHIRCDETFPQWYVSKRLALFSLQGRKNQNRFVTIRTNFRGSGNCTKHNCRCPYMDIPKQEARAENFKKADLMWTPEIEAEIKHWQQTGSFPFSNLYSSSSPSPQLFSFEDLRLIHHAAAILNELSIHHASNFTIWTRHVPL